MFVLTELAKLDGMISGLPHILDKRYLLQRS